MHTDVPTIVHLTTQAQQLYDRGDFEAARAFYEQALTMQRGAVSTTQPDLAASLYGLGMTLLEVGDHVAAESALNEAHTINAAMQPPALAQIARCWNGLGAARFFAGDLDRAQHYTEQALTISEQTLGSDHPDTIESLNQLGIIVNRRGERARSLALHQEALERCERALGDRHRVTAEVCSSLAIRLGAKTPRARSLNERALRIAEHLLGPAHPTTAQMLNNLAALLADQDDHTAARTLLERSLALHEERLGTQHPRLAYVLLNLADIYGRDGELDRARRCTERALIIRERALGAKHAETVHSLSRLVGVYGDLLSQGDPSATQFSMPLYLCLTALQAAAGTLEPEHAHMPGAQLDADRAAAQLHDLVDKIDAWHQHPALTGEQQAALDQAGALQAQAAERYRAGAYAAARTLLESAIALLEQVHGPNHMDLVAPLEQMQQVMQALGQPTAVLPITQRIVDIHIAVLGVQHPVTYSVMSDLALRWSSEYGMEAAMPLFENNLNLLEAALGPSDGHVQMLRGIVERWREAYGMDTPGDSLPVSRSAKQEAARREHHPWIEEVLQGIDDIDWHNLQHAYGSADDVPQLLRLLASDDADVREDVWGSLYGNIWHQGTVYEASAYAVPFLLRLLADHRTPERQTVLDLLHCLATGSSYLAVHAREDDEIVDWRAILADKGVDFEVELQRELSHVRAAHEAVAQGAELFLELAEDADQAAELRDEALSLLGTLPTRAELIVPRLRALLDQTADAALRANIVWALHGLMDDSPRSQHFFAGLMHQATAAELVYSAAIALVHRTRERAPEAAVDVIVDAFRRQGDDEDARFGVYAAGVPALLALGPERNRAVMLRVLPLLHSTSDELYCFAETLLDLVFYAGQNQGRGRGLSRNRQTNRQAIEFYDGKQVRPERSPATLTTAQREVLMAVVAHDPLWTWESNLLSLYGVPAERAALQAWLAD